MLSRAGNQLICNVPLVNLNKLAEDVSNCKLALLHTNFVRYAVACTFVEALCSVLHTETTGDICYDTTQAVHAASIEQM